MACTARTATRRRDARTHATNVSRGKAEGRRTWQQVESASSPPHDARKAASPPRAARAGRGSAHSIADVRHLTELHHVRRRLVPRLASDRAVLHQRLLEVRVAHAARRRLGLGRQRRLCDLDGLQLAGRVAHARDRHAEQRRLARPTEEGDDEVLVRRLLVRRPRVQVGEDLAKGQERDVVDRRERREAPRAVPQP